MCDSFYICYFGTNKSVSTLTVVVSDIVWVLEAANWVSIGSDSGRTHVGRHSSAGPNADLLSINPEEWLHEISNNICKFAFKEMCLKMSTTKGRPFNLNNELNIPDWHL